MEVLAMIAPYPFTKVLQCPQLKLFNRAFTSSQFRRDLTQALLSNEAPDDHPPLIVWQRFDELVKDCPLLDIVFHADLLQVFRHDFPQPSDLVPTIRKQIRRNPQEPRDERQAVPFESWKVGQSLVEDVRRQILRLFAVSHATCDVGVDSLKVVLVQLGKARRILLRSLDLEPFIVQVRQVLVFQRLQSVLRGTSFLIRQSRKQAEKLRSRQTIFVWEYPHRAQSP